MNEFDPMLIYLMFFYLKPLNPFASLFFHEIFWNFTHSKTNLNNNIFKTFQTPNSFLYVRKPFRCKIHSNLTLELSR